ncbi:hypothetical protein HS088_TW16G00354 [Tripterygium wilfordii]|uniref:ApaG domain-containing protein n=1 Tax=Tripterygium wilfordii TaxID=458696 RepID=A0A7J7CIL3_TRIWF|nr:F-box protein SKIP16-like [Tripterygium wilfordii]KAF5733913.1 hypothetical protein HS088_TW16G00354 [Tripterygium wilfordii]
MGLEEVGDLAVHVILVKLGPEDTAKVACVNKRFRASASADSLWSKFCFDDLRLSSPLDPLGDTASSFKEAYQRWRESFGMYPWPLVQRVKRCWDQLRSWLATNFPEAKATLRKGASEDEIEEVEKFLDVKLPLPTRILYRFCDGQEFKEDNLSRSSNGCSLGLIGGYAFYEHWVNVYLLPLSQVVLETRTIVHHLGISGRSKYIIVAASPTFSEKLFFLNCENGQLHVGTRKLQADGQMIQCVPSGMISSVHDLNSDGQQDAMLLWLEEHGRRLQNGIIKLHDEKNFRSISQFPEESPLCSTAVTNGVKVRASAVFVPELADLQHRSEKYWFTYSIRMSLLPEGCIINGMYFSSCQLLRRHWIIRANDTVVSDVNGEAVIGKFPLLRPGQKEFVYESCTPLPTSPGSVEGSFLFVPGRMADPKGGPFEVEVARFPLTLPDYIF